MWPFKKLTPEQKEEREWRQYRNNIAHTLYRQGYRGDPVTLNEAYQWADAIVAERRATLAKIKAEISSENMGA
jgi:hypothetical protein